MIHRAIAFLLGLGWAGSALAADAPPPEPVEVRVVVWRLRALGVDEAIAERVAGLLEQEVSRLPGLRVVPPPEVGKALAADPALAQCGGEPSCLQAMGRAVGAGRIVTGVLGQLGEAYSLDVRLLEVASGRELRRCEQGWSGAQDELIEVMRATATRLLRPERYLGRLRVETNLPGVEIVLDGRPAASTPLAAPLEVAPGTHALKLVRAGFRDVERFVEVAFDREVAVRVQLESTTIEESVPSLASEEWGWLGLKGLAQWDLQGFWAPAAELEGGVKLPFWGGRLAVGLQSGAYGGTRTTTTRIAGQAPRAAEAGLLVWPVELGLVLRVLPEQPLSPYASFAGGLYLAWEELRLEGFPDQDFRRLGFGCVGALGLEYRLGPGVLVLELRYRYLELPEADGGGLHGLLGGLGMGLGYRLML